MGKLHYNQRSVTIDDRALAHLQVVIVNRLRKGESLTLSWLNALSKGDGRGSVWLHPAIPLEFEFSGSRNPEIDRDWIEALGEDGRPARCG